MVFPAQNINVIDPGPGTAAPAVTVQRIISGWCAGGSVAVNTPTSIGDITQVRTLLGYGPLAEDVAYALQEFGGPVIAIKHNITGTSLSAAAMTKVGTGSVIPTLSGVPNDEYAIKFTIITGGALGVGTFKFNLDNFNATVFAPTDSAIRVIPSGGSFVIPGTGITANFPAGTYVAGDTFSLGTTAPIPAITDLGTAAAAVIAASQLVFDLWLLSGTQAVGTTAAALAASFAGQLVTLTNTERYARGLMDIGSGDTAANVKTQGLTWTSTRIDACYGYTLMTSCLPFEGFSLRQVSCVSAHAARAMRDPISADPSRTASGPINNLRAISFDSNYDTTVDAAQISTMRTWTGRPGFYIAGGKLKCPFGSNFTDLQYGRVMDVACLTVYNAQFPFQSASFRTTSTGTVDPRDAATMVNTVQSALAAALTQPINAEGTPGHVSSVVYSISLTANLLTTQQLQTQVALIALGYAKVITTNLFFTVQPA